MTGITDLPPELVRFIIEHLTPDTPSIYSDESLMGESRIVKCWSTTASIFDEGERAVLEGPKNEVSMTEYDGYSDLRALRLTNRYLNEVCTPLVYAELDILPQRAAMGNASAAISHYGEHVRHLGIVVADQTHTRSKAYNSLILEALAVCQRTTSLALLFIQDDDSVLELSEFQALMLRVSGMVILLASQGLLSSLRICSLPIVERYRASFRRSHPGIQLILESLIPLLSRTPPLVHLELSCESISLELYKRIRLNAMSIRSVTFGACLTSKLLKVWGFNGDSNWASNDNLTHLRLISCSNVYPPDVPELVLHFSSLRHLLLAFCGDDSSPVPNTRSTGWSQATNALWRQRQPLDILHMEYMIQWEIMTMGTIPTKEMIVTAIHIGDLAICFKEDPELFPGLNMLRTERPQTGSIPESPTTDEVDLYQRFSSILERRGVSRKEDADRLVGSYRSY